MTFQDVIDGVTAFTDSYAIYVTAGLIVGLGAWAAKKLFKMGR